MVDKVLGKLSFFVNADMNDTNYISKWVQIKEISPEMLGDKYKILKPFKFSLQ